MNLIANLLKYTNLHLDFKTAFRLFYCLFNQVTRVVVVMTYVGGAIKLIYKSPFN